MISSFLPKPVRRLFLFKTLTLFCDKVNGQNIQNDLKLIGIIYAIYNTELGDGLTLTLEKEGYEKLVFDVVVES